MKRFSARKIHHHYFKHINKPSFNPFFLAGIFLLFLFIGFGVGKIIQDKKLINLKNKQIEIKKQETALMDQLVQKVKNKTFL